MIVRQDVRDQLIAYLNKKITLEQLVDWAEKVMRDEELDPQDAPSLRNIIARLGVADVKNFGLLWEDCYAFLSGLGYQIEVKAA